MRSIRLSRLLLATALALAPVAAAHAAPPSSPDPPAASVNPFIGTANGGNVYPGATLPFGMVAFSPEELTLGKDGHNRVAAPGGYAWKADHIRGFALTHLSGTGCAGASGDVPIMPVTEEVVRSPSSDEPFGAYASTFAHANEHAAPGAYGVRLDNGATVDLAATARTGVMRVSFPAGKPARLLFRVSDSEPGSSDARVRIDAAHGVVAGAVTSGNFCGYISPDRRQSYYTLYFVAVADQPFTAGGTWSGLAVHPGATQAQGGTTYGEDRGPPAGKGSGGWIAFDAARSPVVTVRIGVSYVSEAAARANLMAESAPGLTVEAAQGSARTEWNRRLGAVAIEGGTPAQRTTFYTALYHSLLEPNLYNDADGLYLGFDGAAHRLSKGQGAQYANFSGWDVYRSQVQLVTWLDPKVGSDIAQSLLNQADQNGGVWDRWTHLTGRTGVMNGDPSAPAIADIAAFGGRGFDERAAYASLLKAATVPTPGDASRVGCPVLCGGQRPGLADELKLHYLPVGAPGWGSAADTLEMATADFALSELAARAGDEPNRRRLRERAGWWRNLYNPKATADGGYLQPRNADGTWVKFDPNSEDDDNFVEGSAAQYLWMVPFDPRGLFETLGGMDAARARLDRFFYEPGGKLAVTNAGASHAELNNEPSIAAPWLYDFAGEPWKTQELVRATVNGIWTTAPEGIPGNDDLGEMSSWYVWAALGIYPAWPGRAELVLGSPLFPQARIMRPGGVVLIRAPGAGADRGYVTGLRVNGRASSRPWLSSDFVRRGGTLDFDLSAKPDPRWGAAPADAPPSFGPKD
jgi:predicted alpha-1,2-mannosidase